MADQNLDLKKVFRGTSLDGWVEAASHTKYSLERATGLKPVDVRKHLKVLMDTGWVKEHDYGPPVYTLNPDNPKAKILVEFFEKVGYLQS